MAKPTYKGFYYWYKRKVRSTIVLTKEQVYNISLKFQTNENQNN